jgi:hypothetical protein
MKIIVRSALLVAILFNVTSALAQANLEVAQYTEAGDLRYPANLAEWIQTGASLGSEYSEEPFDPQNPGTIGVVQMEPTAYRYFLEHDTYADGTMFLLSFYRAEGKSEPQLPGFVQGPLLTQEIHVIDKARFSDGRGFFIFSNRAPTSTRLADGNECTVCHNEHGAFDGTFVQFYPDLRDHLGIE